MLTLGSTATSVTDAERALRQAARKWKSAASSLAKGPPSVPAEPRLAFVHQSQKVADLALKWADCLERDPSNKSCAPLQDEMRAESTVLGTAVVAIIAYGNRSRDEVTALFSVPPA